MANENGGGDSQCPRPTDQPGWISRRICRFQSYRQKRRAYKEHESAVDRAARSTARATWIIASLTMVTVGVGVSTYLIFDKQLTEMRTARESGNKATADQLSIMQTQAAAMQRQLDELRESNRINLETLRSVQRPFVTSPSVFVRPIEVNGTNLGWRIGPTFYNSGNTPASGVRTWVNYFSPKEGCDLPVGFSFPDGKRINTIQGLLAPHVAINGRGQDFSIEDLEILQTHTRHFYIYGTVRYSDIFSRPENHITQYCWEISAIQGNVRQNPGSVNVVFSVCAEHNCADNSCRPQEFADGPPEPCPPGPK